MRIAIFSDNFHPELSGISDSIIATGKELARRGHYVHYYAPKYVPKNYALVNLPPKEIDFGERIGITRFRSLPVKTGTNQGRMVIPFGIRTLKVKQFNPDVIHINHPYGVNWEGFIASRLLHKPLVGTNHTPIREFIMRYSPIKARWFVKLNVRYDTWFFNRCDFVSSPSKSIFAEMECFDRHIPHEVISNPLYPNLFKSSADREAIRKKYNLSGFVLLYAGRLASEKNIDLMIRAAALLKKDIPDLMCAIVGKGPQEQELKALAKKLGIESSAEFLGFLKTEELPLAYAAADIFIMMSTAETQGMAAMNALLTEVPVVAANAWGLKEYIRDSETGFLVEPGDLHALAAKIKYLYENPELRKKMGRAGRKFTEGFSAEKIAEKWERIYAKVIWDYNKPIRNRHSERSKESHFTG